MKSNTNGTTNSAKNSGSKRHIATDKKTTVRNMDTTPPTEKARAKHSHNHGMGNEGTTTNYEEQR